MQADAATVAGVSKTKFIHRIKKAGRGPKVSRTYAYSPPKREGKSWMDRKAGEKRWKGWDSGDFFL